MKRFSRLQLPLLVLTIAVAVLSPPIPLTSTFSLRPEFILAGILFIWLLPARGLGVLKHPVFRWMGLLALVILISLGYSALVIRRPTSLQDTFEVVKVGVYAVVFYAACAMTFEAGQFRRIAGWIQGMFFASAIIGILQYFNLLDINAYLSPLYTRPSLGTQLAGYRVIGTTSNPNYFGMLMLLGSCLSLAGFLWCSVSRMRWLYVPGFVACMASMMLAASRTVLAILPIAFLFILVQFAVRSRNDKAKLRLFGAVAGLLLLMLVLVLVLLPHSWFVRMGELLDVFESQSMQEKFGSWRAHWELYLQSPLFGHGPAKGLISLNVDNEWLLFLVRYGIAGPVLAFLLGFGMFRASNDLVRRTPSLDARGFGIALQAFILVAGVFMVTASVYHHQQVMAILLLLVGLGQGLLRGSGTDQRAGADTAPTPTR